MSRKTKAWLHEELQDVMTGLSIGMVSHGKSMSIATELLLEYISDREITEAYESIRKWDI